MPHTTSSNNVPEAMKIAVLLPVSMPTKPMIATVARTRTDCCARAIGGRLRTIHAARKT